LIKEESTSELLRFTIRHILNQVHNQPEYLILLQKQQQQKVHNNQQQQLVNQYSLQPSTITAASHQQHQVPNTSLGKNLDSQKNMISSSSLLSSTQTN
jgi:hypothetical protein